MFISSRPGRNRELGAVRRDVRALHISSIRSFRTMRSPERGWYVGGETLRKELLAQMNE
jgi:hypothetical protein